MRLNSKDLHKLVRGLSATEKMLFKRFNKQADGNTAYLILFDILAVMDEYSEENLKRQLARKHVTGYLKSLKTYLYDEVMLFLRVHADTKIKKWKLRELNNDADILQARGLSRNAFELYTEQLELSKTMMNPVFEVTALDNFIIYSIRSIDTLMLQRYELELAQRVSAFNNLMEAQVEFRKLGAFYAEHYPIRSKQTMAQLNTIAKSKIMQLESNMLSPLAHIFYFNFHTYAALMQNDFDRAFQFAKARYDYQRHLTNAPEGMINHWVNGLELLINTCIKCRYYQDALNYYLELKKLTKGITTFAGQMHRHYCFAILNAEMDWKEATTHERNATLTFFVEHKSESTVIAGAMMSLAYACFRNKEYSSTLTLLEHVITEKFSFQHSVLQTEARLLGILTHYELKNYLLISSLANNTKRFLKNEAKLFPLENALLNGIKHMSEKSGEREMQTTLAKLKKNLAKMMENPLERNAMSGFDFVGWIDGKLKV